MLHGQPTPEELATVLAVVQARAAAQAAAEATRRASGPASPWTDPARRIRVAPRPGSHAWRTSGWAGG